MRNILLEGIHIANLTYQLDADGTVVLIHFESLDTAQTAITRMLGQTNFYDQNVHGVQEEIPAEVLKTVDMKIYCVDLKSLGHQVQ